MKEKYFPYIIAAMFAVSFYSIFKSLGEDSQKNASNYNVNVTQAVSADKGLNLQAVGELLKKAKNGEEFEKLLNDPKSGVNNLDLNGDGKVDYIKVTEFGEGDVKGFSLSTEPKKGEEQEIATIKIEKAEDQGSAVVETKGNPQIYGHNHYYQSSWSGLGTGMLLGYLFSSHRPYASPFSYGNYPYSYNSYRTVPYDAYTRRTGSMIPDGAYKRTSSGRYDHISSPNNGKMASSIKAPLKNPSRSQKSFQTRQVTRKKSPVFGRKKASPARRPMRSRGFGRSGRRR
ncbi:MAG: hypothetical protein HRU09_15185 [Oligoflexales bacterium]|nr:hypothetical protein [Oligoflexales bacterium]